MNTLQSWISAAKSGQPVWLPDVLDACARMDGSGELCLRLRLCDGGEKERRLRVPRWETEEQRRFVLEMLVACTFNLLSACSGAMLSIALDSGDAALVQLREELIGRLNGPGTVKALRVARRLCAASELPAFSIRRAELSELSPLVPAPLPKAAGLGERLRDAVEASKHGLCCGIDVGGTDVKIAVSRGGILLLAEEYDWDPSRYGSAEELMRPILSLVRHALAQAEPEDPSVLFDSIGVSFPDVVIRSRIVGGETPKTRGIRENEACDYEEQLQKLGLLRERLSLYCQHPESVHIINDGSMAAFGAAVELACAGEDAAISNGVFAHTLGTDLGTGWLRADGSIPPWPLELYDVLTDLGSWPQRAYPPEDLRSVRNENSGLPGARRYLGQAAAFRLAWELEPALLDGYASWEGEILSMPSVRRKDCLEHLMALAQDGNAAAREIFRRIGLHLGQLSREAELLLEPETGERFLFGRFLRHPACLELLREGCREAEPSLKLLAADRGLCRSPLMLQLAQGGSARVASLGQAVAAIYYGLDREAER